MKCVCVRVCDVLVCGVFVPCATSPTISVAKPNKISPTSILADKKKKILNTVVIIREK